jgi:hypothetical protein
MRKIWDGMDEFISAVCRAVERADGKRPSEDWRSREAVTFRCSEDKFLAALRTELGGADTVRRAGWPNSDKWAAFYYGPEPIIFKFSSPSTVSENLTSISLHS